MYDYKLKTVKNAKTGRENVQLKMKTVKSIRNRYFNF